MTRRNPCPPRRGGHGFDGGDRDECRTMAAPPGPRPRLRAGVGLRAGAGGRAADRGPRLALEGGSPRVVEHRWATQVTTGRDLPCDLASSADGASRRHATITAQPGGWLLADASTGGTWSDGRRLTAP